MILASINNQKSIFESNKIDMFNAKTSNLNQQLVKQLALNQTKLDTIIAGIDQLISKSDPINKMIYEIELANNLKLQKINTSMGVLMIIFESRPDILPQIISLAIKSGNGVILKGGKEARETNNVLYEIITQAISNTNNVDVIGKNLIHLVETREGIMGLLKSLDKSDIDLIIPRGSNKLVKSIENNTNIPVLGHSEGLCHLYIDSEADISKAMVIIKDSKCNYPAACNSIETLLIHKKIGDRSIRNIINLLKNECNAKINIGPLLYKEFGINSNNLVDILIVL